MVNLNKYTKNEI